MLNSINKNWLFRDRIIGIILLIISLAGLLHIIFGTWSSGAGEQAKLFPKIIYFILLSTSLLLILQKSDIDQSKSLLPSVDLVSTLVFISLGGMFFFLVYHVGLAISIFLYMITIFLLLTVNPLKHWKQIVIPAITITVILSIVFTRLMPIVLPNALLF